MIRANSRHVGSPSRSEREEFSRTSNWRSSLRSTKEQRGYENGNGFRSSLRSYTDKENQVKTKATRGEPKTPTKAVENPPAKEKKSEPKTDVANRAKKKFLEHLSKFQKESKATGFNVNRNNNFYRSYRKPNEDKESPGLRRSYRVPASKPSVKAEPTGISSNPVFKRPQRKDKTSESQIGGITKENTSKSVRSVKSESTSSIKYDSDHSSLDFSVKANVGSCNSSRPTSASSTVTSDSSRSASSGAKKSTRAELAMERHMDRMRKASQNSPTSNPPYNRSASSSKLRQKSTTEAERIDDVISPTRFTIPKETTTRQSNSNQDDKSLSELIDDWIIEGLSDTSFTLNDFASAGSKPKKSSTTSATEPGKILSPKPKSSTVIPEWNSVNIVEDDVFDVTASPLKKREINRCNALVNHSATRPCTSLVCCWSNNSMKILRRQLSNGTNSGFCNF